MKNIFLILAICLTVLAAFANEPLSVTITGPSKIFTNDIVNYSASVSGAQNVSYSWNISYGSESSSGGSLELTAPSTPTIIILQCTASSGTGNNTITDTVTQYANSFNDSFILYYSERNDIVSWRCHAARRSSRMLGCHSDWNMFESKMGKLKILMHRAEQLEDGIYGIVWRKYK